MKVEIKKERTVIDDIIIEIPDKFDPVVRYTPTRHADAYRSRCRSQRCRVQNPWSLDVLGVPQKTLTEDVGEAVRLDSGPASIAELYSKYPGGKIASDYDSDLFVYHEREYPNPDYKKLAKKYNDWIVLAKEAYEWMKENNLTPGLPAKHKDRILECKLLEA